MDYVVMRVKHLKLINQGLHADKNCPQMKLGYNKA